MEVKELKEKIYKTISSYRLDILATELQDNEDGKNIIEFVSSDTNTQIIYPDWFNKIDSKGAIIFNNTLNDHVKIKVNSNCKVKINLKNSLVMLDDKIYPIYAVYKSFKINTQEMLDEKVVLWHNKSLDIISNLSAKKGDVIELELELELYNYNRSELQDIAKILKINTDKNINQAILEIMYEISSLNNKDNLNEYLVKKIIYLENELQNIRAYLQPKLKILSLDSTMDELLKSNKSLTRFGDGEIGLMFGKFEVGFQKHNPKLSSRLLEIINNNNENLITCIGEYYNNCESFDIKDESTWLHFVTKTKRELYNAILNFNKIYGNTEVTRNSKNVLKFKKLWQDKDVVIVEGEATRIGVGNDLLDNVKSIKRILCPKENSFDKYDEILKACNKIDNSHLFLIALGPTATVLAYDLTVGGGYRALDIGHLDIIYECYLRGFGQRGPVPGKYVNEINQRNVPECKDKDYLSQIVEIIK